MNIRNFTARSILFLFAFLCSVQGFSEEKIIFSEKFNSPDALKKWRITEYPGSGTFQVVDGALSVTHKNNPGKGSYIEFPLPPVSRGQVDFDVLIDPDRVNPTIEIGLTFEIFNIATFWHDSLRDWRMYFPEPNAARMPNFNLEPVGHHKISNVGKHKYVHYRILFDEKLDLVEFYTGDMNDPKAARYDVSVFGHAFYRGGYLRIGSFAVTTDTYRTLVDNVVIRELPDSADALKKDQILIFDGISSDHFKYNQILKKKNTFGTDKPRRYAWNSPGPNLLADKNNFRYEVMPGLQSVERASLIIFNDAPNVDAPLQKQILKSVHNGADLLILSGVFSLSKGGYNDSPIGNVLPVTLTGKWDIEGDDKTPVVLDANSELVTEKSSVMYYYWNLKPTDDAEILATAANGKIPVFLRRKFGKGTISVLTATAYGPAEKNSFWKTSFPENLIKFLGKNRTVSDKNSGGEKK